LRIDCEEAENWSDQEVVERWFRLYPPRGADRKPMKPTEEMVQAKLNNSDWVRVTRSRLSSLGWFMKCLKEPLARLANKQDGCTGAFFEGRFKSIAILDQESLLSVAAYIDLNPVAAGIVPLPEQSPHTSEGKPGTHLFIDNPTNQLNHSSALNALCGGNKRRLTSNTHPFTGSA
jgi:hypothetical protein